jgi:hypothetical protein
VRSCVFVFYLLIFFISMLLYSLELWGIPFWTLIVVFQEVSVSSSILPSSLHILARKLYLNIIPKPSIPLFKSISWLFTEYWLKFQTIILFLGQNATFLLPKLFSHCPLILEYIFLSFECRTSSQLPGPFRWHLLCKAFSDPFVQN